METMQGMPDTRWGAKGLANVSSKSTASSMPGYHKGGKKKGGKKK